MRLKFLIGFLLSICCNGAFCQQVTREEATAVAKTELFYTKGVNANITNVHQFDSNGHTLLYEVVSDRGINVLVTGNKKCLPVVGRYKTIDTTSMFDKFESLPCGLRLFLMNYFNQLKYCLKKTTI